MAKRKKKHSTLTAGLVGAALGAAGAWFLYATETGRDKREELLRFADKIKDEVADEIHKVQAKTEPAVHKVIETVMEKYRAAKNIDPAIIGKIADDLKRRWAEVKDQFEGGEKESSDDVASVGETSGGEKEKDA